MSEAALVLVYTLYADQQAAHHAVRDVVQAGLAACANILAPSESFYIWDGTLEQQHEYPVLFKTTPDRVEALRQRLAETHPYDVPALLSWPVDATPDYARWAGEMTAKT